MKISAVYKITNTVTGDFYIGSSNDVKRRWTDHKKPSMRKKYPNNQMYLDMQKYGIDKFEFEIFEEAEPYKLKEVEQQFIEKMHPTYNRNRADGCDFERYKKSQNKYNKSDKGKKSHRKAQNKYDNQLCCFNGQTITLAALSMCFRSQGIPHPIIEAKKYLVL